MCWHFPDASLDTLLFIFQEYRYHSLIKANLLSQLLIGNLYKFFVKMLIKHRAKIILFHHNQKGKKEVQTSPVFFLQILFWYALSLDLWIFFEKTQTNLWDCIISLIFSNFISFTILLSFLSGLVSEVFMLSL